MAPTDPGIPHHRHSLFSTEAGTAISHSFSPFPCTPSDTAISTDNLLTSPSQNTPPWAFPSHSSPPSHPSPPSYQYSTPSNHPSPSGSGRSPSSMIGATPTFYDPDLEAQPPSQDYHDWTTSYEQQQQQHQLALAQSSYPPQSSTAAPRHERQTQPTARHLNQYQFVQQHPPPAVPDPTQFTYFNPLQNQFNDRPSHSQRQQPVPDAVTQPAWSQEHGPAFPHPSTSDTSFLDTLIYPLDHQTQQQQQADHLTPGLALTPVSDGTLQATSRISPHWDQHRLPSPASTSTAPTVVVRPFRRSDKPSSSQARRKRPKPESEDDDDDDAGGPSADPNVQQLHPNRLPGACTYCKRLKMKCYFPPGENVCKRCRSGKHDCIVEGRKPRSAPNKREYLLAQMKQKDELIDSLVKQLHNPYLATTLSIEAYRNATTQGDAHRQNVIAWLDRLQSTVRSPARSTSATNPFQVEMRTGKAGGHSDDSDEEPAAQKRVQQRPPSSGSDEGPVSPNTLVESDIDPYPDDAVPIGLLANLAISTSRDVTNTLADTTRKENTPADDEEVGVANKSYFMPGPAMNLDLRKRLIDKTSPPDILVHKLVTPEDVEKLFDIFYTRINPFISLLEPKLHTPAKTFSRCPFLFTVVCAIALRYSEKREVYPIAMHFAKTAAANALIDGWKSVELCQAYILLSIYSVPARRWEEDRSWLYTGLAIRIATDLNLHILPPKKPTTEEQELEMLNRTRVWIICFNIDKSTATQFGKPSTLKEDFIVRKSLEWYKSSPYNHQYDVHIIAYTSLFRIVNKFHQEVFSDSTVPNGLNRSIDFRAVTLEHDRLLTLCRQEWAERFQQHSDHNDAACEFRVKLLPFYTNYARLVMFSFGFQKAFERGFEADDEVFFTRSLESAKTVVTVLVDTLVPTGYIRFAPDAYFVFASFASAFMLKLLRPACLRFITPGLEAEIYQVIERLIATIGSPQIAIDERHTPKLYSRFLASLLAKHKRDGSAQGRMPQQGPPPQPVQTGSSTPRYQQPQPQPSQSQNAGSTSSSVNNASAPDLHQSTVAQNSGVTGPTGFAEAVSATGAYVLDVDGPSPEFTFGVTEQPGDRMDFTFDTITAPGNDELLAAMQAIQNPAWWQNYMMPGFSWPLEESILDHAGAAAGDGVPMNNYQNLQSPAEVLG